MPGDALWVALLLLVGIWLMTIVEIPRSSFVDPTNKIVWLLVVILLNIPGALLYSLFGRSQRVARS